MTSPFGWRVINGYNDYHKGLDLVALDDITLIAPCDGVIGTSAIITDHNNATWEWGNYIRLDCPNGLYIFMCHLKERFVKAGQKVKRGDKLGIMGNTGYSFGAHTHFEIRTVYGESLNPCRYLDIPNVCAIYKNEEIDDMTKEEVKAIFKECMAEYEAEQKKKPLPYGKDELDEAIALGITDGTRPCEATPRFQTAIMCKRVYEKLAKKL